MGSRIVNSLYIEEGYFIRIGKREMNCELIIESKKVGQRGEITSKTSKNHAAGRLQLPELLSYVTNLIMF
jgi:hypothetical protein